MMTKTRGVHDDQTVDLAISLILNNKISIRAASRIYSLPFSLLQKRRNFILMNSVRDEPGSEETTDQANKDMDEGSEIETRFKTNRDSLRVLKNKPSTLRIRKRKTVPKRRVYIRRENLQELIKVNDVNQSHLHDLLDKQNEGIHEFINQSSSSTSTASKSLSPIPTPNRLSTSSKRSSTSSTASSSYLTPNTSKSGVSNRTSISCGKKAEQIHKEIFSSPRRSSLLDSSSSSIKSTLDNSITIISSPNEAASVTNKRKNPHDIDTSFIDQTSETESNTVHERISLRVSPVKENFNNKNNLNPPSKPELKMSASLSVNVTKKSTDPPQRTASIDSPYDSIVIITENIEQTSNSGLDSLKDYLVEQRTIDSNKAVNTPPNNIFKCLSCQSLFADLRKLHEHQDLLCSRTKRPLCGHDSREPMNALEGIPCLRCYFCKQTFLNKLTFMSHTLVCSTANCF